MAKSWLEPLALALDVKTDAAIIRSGNRMKAVTFSLQNYFHVCDLLEVNI